MKRLPGIKSNVLLAPYTTFRIGGPAKYFFVAKNKKELVSVINWANQKGLPFFILGGGSNILVSDDGFPGLVIKIHNSKFIIQNSNICVGASVALSELVKETARAGLSGLEWAAGIPGTVGGAIWGNAGAYGRSISESVESVEVFDFNNETPKQSLRHATGQAIEQWSKERCCFAYRSSIFSASGRPAVRFAREAGRVGRKEKPFIILSATFTFKKRTLDQITNKIKQVLAARDQRVPGQPSAGCVFKNIVLEDWPGLKEQIPADKIQNGKVAAGYLIEQCGLKGRQIGQARISEKHGNFIVNFGQAKARDVMELIALAKREVRKKFGLTLEEEIKYL